MSQSYREVRERKAQEKAQQGHFQTLQGFGLGEFAGFDNGFMLGLGESPADAKKHQSDFTTPNMGKKPQRNFSKTNKTTTHKAQPQKKKSTLEKQYERFSLAYELDVR